MGAAKSRTASAPSECQSHDTARPSPAPPFAADPLPWGVWAALVLLGLAALVALFTEGLGMRYIPNNRVGIVEKLWSPKGSVTDGRLIALNGEAGFQADLLRGGIHFGLWRWQYRIHK